MIVEFPKALPFFWEAFYPRQVADLAVFKIPGFLEGLTFSEAAMASRTYPIEYESTTAHLEEGILQLPESMRLRSAPDALTIKNPFFEFDGSYERVGDTALKFRATFRRIEKKVPLSGYETFKADVDRIRQFARQRVFAVQAHEKGVRP